MRRSSLALAGLGATALAGALWGATAERSRFQLRRETMPILDAGSEPITILHLSDLHLAPWNSGAISWVRALAESTPDLVIGTGDFFGHPEGLAGITEALLPLAGIPGVVTHGSNDRMAPRWKNPLSYLLGPSTPGATEGTLLDFAGLTHLYTEVLGWKDIDNSAARMTINGSVLDFIGVGDAHHGLDDLVGLPGTVEDLRENEEGQSRPHHSITTIGVTHAPYRRVLDAFVTQGAEAIFAGHTHGGQVCLPGGHALTTNCDLPLDQASGLSLWRHAQRSSYLEVSAGLGTSIYAPIRLFCPPEAVLVTLVGDDGAYA